MKNADRITRLTKQVKESKVTFEHYTTENDKKIDAVKKEHSTTCKDLKDLQTKVNQLETQLTATNSKLDVT